MRTKNNTKKKKRLYMSYFDSKLYQVASCCEECLHIYGLQHIKPFWQNQRKTWSIYEYGVWACNTRFEVLKQSIIYSINCSHMRMCLYTHLWAWVYSKQPMQELYISTLKVSVFLFLMFEGTVILALKENNGFW